MPIPAKSFIRISPSDTIWHRNSHAPETPTPGETVCCLTVQAPIYADAIHGLGQSPASVPEQCLACNHESLRAKTAA